MIALQETLAERADEPLRVLLIDENPVQAEMVSEMLGRAPGRRARVVRRARLDAGLTRLAAGGIDTVLLDLARPGSDGVAAVQRVVQTAPDVPVIVLSGSADEASATRAVRGGAQDVLVRGEVTADSLARAIQYAVERHRVLSAVRGLSLIDELTGLYNRRGFISVASSHLHGAQRAARRFVLLYGDLDGLKEINDTFGHAAGDAAIATTADLLRASVRASDIIARLGGDEFVVLAVEAGTATETSLLARVQRTFAAFDLRSSLPYTISLSAGVAGYDFTSSLTLEQMLAEADRGLYARKRSRGRERSVLQMAG